MIYFVSNQNVIKDTSIEYCSVEESLTYLHTLEWVSVDTETTGLDRFIDKILLLQLGNEEKQFIIDTTTVNIQLYKRILEKKNLILQGAKFDFQFFYIQNIIPQGKIWDTMLAEQVLYNGYNPVANLEFLAEKYCEVVLNKAHRINFTRNNFVISMDDIVYAAEDIAYLPDIKQQQEAKAIKKGVYHAIRLENKFVRVLAYIEFCGIYLDKDRWIAKYESAQKELDKIESELDTWVINNGYTQYKQMQQDLFVADLTLKPTRKTTLNWSSSKQVISLFEQIGINITVVDNKSGKSVSEKVITPQKGEFEIIKLYLQYQTVKKDFSTYGAKFLAHIHPVTGRIHSNFIQLQVTSRLSSNGPNLQNLPADARTRSCFRAETGNILIDCDYKAQEDIIFVNNSKEPKMIEFYKMDDADGHSYVAKLCYPNKLKDIPIEKVKSVKPKLRQKSKSAKFSIHYGGTGYTIAKNLNLTEDEGNAIEHSYLTAFPAIHNYLTEVKKLAKKRKFILISPVTGRKFWANNYDEMTWKEQNHFAKLATNYPIQGQSAELTKLGLIYFFQWILDNNYFNTVKIANAVHDEALVENPIELTDLVSSNLKSCLEKGAEPYCKIVPLKADLEIADYWVH